MRTTFIYQAYVCGYLFIYYVSLPFSYSCILKWFTIKMIKTNNKILLKMQKVKKTKTFNYNINIFCEM